ncbi:iron-containing alcohol dehydrogenase [Rubrimonas cliftonensis]|uniref:Glycerol-1-phosphate dehydrogenase [NAD(P)+] n=1 Tax=Rubrimonas cliftonensis TaxID=89524 RepID=A0A1H4C3A9_9RHOB|nr:iron-containing alcohol dehydrogenase [Rubrimonas cliftonensis]SEA54773.1 glycerol-1-phosphate dehydrogenase [NAD(P)+] [Rubrimonas cliftonensis]
MAGEPEAEGTRGAIGGDGPPPGGWTALIDDLLAGRWVSPLTGATAPPAPYERIVIAGSLEGEEAALIDALGLRSPFAVVADRATWEAMGARVAAALARLGPVEPVLLDHPHADLAAARKLAERLKGAEGVVAVGSGTINDLAKYVTAQDGRRYAVFGTAASMNGYTSTTASMTLDSGLKVSLPAHAPAGFFVDLGVSAAAPRRLAAAGFGDCLCRSVAQVDWWMAHRLLGAAYHHEPYLIEMPDEAALNARAAGVGAGDPVAIGYLYRVLTLCGLGISFTGVSHHGSMGEHQISHYIDCFARERHPGTLHGQQVGVASLTMARIQQAMLASETPPKLKPTHIDAADMARRMGPAISGQCLEEYRAKALDADGAAKLNARLEAIWPELREECGAMTIPVAEMTRLLAAAGGATTARELGVPRDFWREAVRHAHEMRNRFSFADLACDAGLLDEMAAAET